MVENNKLKSYIGFALRARKIVTGINGISFAKNIKLMFICNSASENSKKEGLKMARRFNVPLVLSKETLLDDLVHKDNCKMFAVLDDNFKDTILKNINNSYEIIYKGEDNNERD